MKTRPASALTILALGMSACSTTPTPPPFFVENEFGIVYAEDPATARHFADLVASAVDPVCSALPGLRERWVDLRIVGDISDATAHGLTFDERIELDRGLPGDSELFILAHELAHYFCDPTWKRLPHVLEEGLCDWSAMRVDPRQGVHRRSEHLILIATLSAGGVVLDVPPAADSASYLTRRFRFRADVPPGELPDPVALLDLDSEQLEGLQSSPASVAIYAVGWLLVERIGTLELRRLCQRAVDDDLEQVPTSWILDAAGFPAHSRSAWWPAAEPLLGPDETAHVLERAFSGPRDRAPQRSERAGSAR